jgi:hypothetical protein
MLCISLAVWIAGGASGEAFAACVLLSVEFTEPSVALAEVDEVCVEESVAAFSPGAVMTAA